ncbi:hypothetical protein NC652_034067 [Populus alba x Populus x berolinensis]|nr:hypothetical protein NC652_034067 [Populus alba x Populus x berolinensis]
MREQFSGSSIGRPWPLMCVGRSCYGVRLREGWESRGRPWIGWISDKDKLREEGEGLFERELAEGK